MRSSHSAAVCFALLLGCVAAVAEQSPNPRAPMRTLTTAREVHNLSPGEAARIYPIHLHGIVTYFDPELNSLPDLFVSDSTGSIFIEFAAQPNLTLQAGDVVDVVGVSGPGDYAPVVDQPRVRFIRHSHLPDHAFKATLAQLLSGSLDGQWVEIDGVVHAAHMTHSNAILDLATAGGSLRATTRREPGVRYEALVDSLVRIHGNAGPVFNWKEQMVDAQLFFPSLQELKVIKAAPRDSFALPAIPLSRLMRFSPSQEIPHRVHVQGAVTLHWPGRTLCIQQGRDSLCMDTAQRNRVRPGTLVDAIGFPTVGAYKYTLENASFRAAADGGSPLTAGLITADEALRGDRDGQLVQIDGELVGQDHVSGDLKLMLSSGNVLVPAILPLEMAGHGTRGLKDGSILRLTGICESRPGAETWNLRNGEVQPGSVQILLRSVDDVQVVRSPSWWSPGHALEVLAVVGLLALVSLAWIVVLRRRVDQQTRALRTSEERLRNLSEHDALTSLPNRLLLNDRLNMAVERAKRFKTSMGVLMVDVDRFKEVNDTHGHHAGDKVLCELAKRISHAVRLTDTVARIGGDEFIVLLPDLRDPAEARTIASKIVSAVARPIDVEPKQVPVTLSVGVCTYPETAADAEKLLENADAAMYGVKTNGRNGFNVYGQA